MTVAEHMNAASFQAGVPPRALIPQTFDAVMALADVIVVAGMAPKDFDAAKCAVSILHGMETGLTPMMALQAIAVINGRPTIWGDGALGLIQGSGLLETFKEYYEGEPGTDAYTAFCVVKRKGDPEVKINGFSVAAAKKAGLWTKKGPWTEYPERMMKMRARSWSLRDGFSDVLKGLQIREEVQDYEHDARAPRTVRQVGATVATNPLDDDEENDVVDVVETSIHSTVNAGKVAEIAADRKSEGSAKPDDKSPSGEVPGAAVAKVYPLDKIIADFGKAASLDELEEVRATNRKFLTDLSPDTKVKATKAYNDAQERLKPKAAEAENAERGQGEVQKSTAAADAAAAGSAPPDDGGASGIDVEVWEEDGITRGEPASSGSDLQAMLEGDWSVRDRKFLSQCIIRYSTVESRADLLDVDDGFRESLAIKSAEVKEAYKAIREATAVRFPSAKGRL